MGEGGLTDFAKFDALELLAVEVLLFDFKASIPKVVLIVKDAPPEVHLERADHLPAATTPRRSHRRSQLRPRGLHHGTPVFAPLPLRAT
jgi:hypothetical protein